MLVASQEIGISVRRLAPEIRTHEFDIKERALPQIGSSCGCGCGPARISYVAVTFLRQIAAV